MPDALVYSFDLFDTCITRMHAYPRDLFFDLGLRLAPTSASEKVKQRFARRFQRARIRAEKIANWRARRARREHADIFAIYQHIQWLMRLPQSVDALVQAELALEEESLYPINETVPRLQQLHAQGKRVVFVSDMYIPARLLEPLLQRMGVMQEGDGLYVSCDVGASKHSGWLFQHVLQAEGIAATDMLHTGDNAHADIAMAQALGIRTEHFTAAHLTEHEALIAGPRIPRPPSASWQAAFSRRCRLAARHQLGPDAAHPLDGVIFGVIVPFLLAYVQWVLDDARQRGIQRLYFVARDGEVLLKIAQALKPDGVELRYLYGSRRAWLPAIAHLDSRVWEKSLTVAGQANSPQDIAERAGLDPGTQENARTALKIPVETWCQSLSKDDAQRFVSALLTDEQTMCAIRCKGRSQHATAMNYLRQEGLLDAVSWALVDVGWALSMQGALKALLSTEKGQQYEPIGYYFALAAHHCGKADAGDFRPLVPQTGSLFSRRAAVVEHLFLPATHPSTSAYVLNEAGRCEPVFGTEIRTDSELLYARHLQVCACRTADLVSEASALAKGLQTYRQSILQNCARFIERPLEREAMAASALQASVDMRHEVRFAKPLCRRLTWPDILTILQMTVSARRGFATPAFMWLEGSVALSSMPVRMIFGILQAAQKLMLRRTNGG